MNTELFIAPGLGLLRACREVQGPRDRKSHLELIEELKPGAAHKKLSGPVTDQPSRFPRGNEAGQTTGDLSGGERRNLESEDTRRLLTRRADRVSPPLSDDGATSCSLAASAPIHRQLLARFEPKARGKTWQGMASDPARTEASELG